jgi:hypothetical protein
MDLQALCQLVTEVRTRLDDARNELDRTKDLVVTRLDDLETALPPVTSDDARNDLVATKSWVESDLSDLEDKLQEVGDALDDVEDAVGYEEDAVGDLRFGLAEESPARGPARRVAGVGRGRLLGEARSREGG